MKEYEVLFTGKIIVTAKNEDDAREKAEEELSWCRSYFDLTGAREIKR